MITQKELLEIVEYKDGVLYWRHKKQGRRNNVVGSFDGLYWRACINYTRYQVHHLVWLYHNGVFPRNGQLDHEDGNTNNNSIENLRDETQKVNARNGKLSSNNKSGHNRVFWRKGRSRWVAEVMKQNGSKVSRSFRDKEEAGKWQKEESLKHGFHKNHGEKR